MNPLFNQYGNQPMSQLLQRFQQFQKTFQGDPKQQVQQLLNSGKVTQAQYDQAVKMAQQLQKMLGK